MNITNLRPSQVITARAHVKSELDKDPEYIRKLVYILRFGDEAGQDKR